MIKILDIDKSNLFCERELNERNNDNKKFIENMCEI